MQLYLDWKILIPQKMAFRDYLFLLLVVVKLFFSPIDISFNAEFSNSFKGKTSNIPDRICLSRVSGSQLSSSIAGRVWSAAGQMLGTQPPSPQHREGRNPARRLLMTPFPESLVQILCVSTSHVHQVLHPQLRAC